MTAINADEIRSAVARSYGKRVAAILDRGETIQLVASGGACCSDSCCSDDSSSDDPAIDNVARLYSASDTADLPDSVTSVAFGCGNPAAIAGLAPGETVLDLGSGGGIDCFLAARMVGPTGSVLGVDMTPNMVSLARANASKVDATNVEFRLGEIEHLPIPDATINVIISNCVINLAPDKAQVFREAFRVLKPGGRLQVSDMIWEGKRPAESPSDLESWAGCVAGAITAEEYATAMEEAGFTSVAIETAPHGTIAGLASASVFALKP